MIHVTGMPNSGLTRCPIINPGCIRSGSGVVTAKPISGGVMTARLRGSEKNVQASSRAIGTICRAS